MKKVEKYRREKNAKREMSANTRKGGAASKEEKERKGRFRSLLKVKGRVSF